jgi:hypothetical protein
MGGKIQTKAVDCCFHNVNSGLPYFVTCVEVKDQIDLRIREQKNRHWWNRIWNQCLLQREAVQEWLKAEINTEPVDCSAEYIVKKGSYIRT